MKNNFTQQQINRKIPPVKDPNKRAPGKKNRKKWCGGHVGREHVVIVARSTWCGGFPCRVTPWWNDPQHWSCYHILKCEVCGRHMGYPDQCPDRTIEE